MKTINFTNWKSFKISDIFITEEKNGKLYVPTGASVPKKDLNEDGKIPRISVSGVNNGIVGYYSYKGCKISNYRVYTNFISVSFLGTIFYHENSASLDMKVHCLKPRNYNLNKYTGMFLVSVLKVALKSNYADQLSSSTLPNFSLDLPEKNGIPDWIYIEKYEREIEYKSQEKLKSFRTVKGSRTPININEWESFKITKLFNIQLSKGDNQAKNLNDGNIPLVSTLNLNNGICKYIEKGDGISELYPEGLITVDMFGHAYYQNKSFYAVSHGHVNILTPKFTISEKIGLYLSTVIQKSFYEKYGFMTMCTMKILKQEKIMLPVQSNSKEPDWKFMENYITAIQSKSQKRIDALKMLI